MSFACGFPFGLHGVVHLVQLLGQFLAYENFSFCIFVCQINRYGVPRFFFYEGRILIINYLVFNPFLSLSLPTFNFWTQGVYCKYLALLSFYNKPLVEIKIKSNDFENGKSKITQISILHIFIIWIIKNKDDWIDYSKRLKTLLSPEWMTKNCIVALLWCHYPDAVPLALGRVFFHVFAAFNVGLREFVVGVEV